jgi:hypothetical protein
MRMRKNPLMSLWLSNANRVAGMARGQFAAEAKRRQNEILREANTSMAAFWSAALKPVARKTRKK